METTEINNENYWLIFASEQLDLKQYQAAYDAAVKAFAINPSAEALFFRANAEMKLEQYDLALETALEALKLDPNHDLALWMSSYLYYRDNKLELAAQYAKHALEVNPGLKMMRVVLGDYLRIRKGDYPKAISLFAEELQLDPNSLRAYYCLGLTYSDLGLIEQGIQYLQKHLTLIPDDKDVYSRLLTLNLYCPNLSLEDIYKEANKYYQTCYPDFAANPNQGLAFDNLDLNPKKEKLRIGFISADFRGHVTLSWVEGLFTKLRERNFEIYCFSNAEEDEDTKIWQQGVSGWTQIKKLSDKEAAKAIKEQKIDVLIDITGHLNGQRLGVMAHKPAPVQASWLGQSGPFGFPQIDYMITDKSFVRNKEEEKFYNEKIYRMPHYFAAKPLRPYDIKLKSAPVNNNGFVTFGSFNMFVKINKQVLQTWAEILRQIPNSRLLIKSSSFEKSPHIDYVKSFFPDSADRLILEPGSAVPEYLDSYNRVDIVLDSFPVGGGTTNHDTLLMSTPYITLCGVHAAHRGGTIVEYLGHDELIAFSKEEYIAKAVELASDKERINFYKNTLRDKYKASKLCDVDNFPDDFANALRDMWKQSVTKL